MKKYIKCNNKRIYFYLINGPILCLHIGHSFLCICLTHERQNECPHSETNKFLEGMVSKQIGHS